MLHVMAKPRFSPEASSVGAILDGLIPQLELLRLDWVDELVKIWPEIAGKAVADHTRPGTLNNRTLVVYVDQHVWMQELQRSGKKQLLANIWKKCGTDKVRDLIFRLDPGR